MDIGILILVCLFIYNSVFKISLYIWQSTSPLLSMLKVQESPDHGLIEINVSFAVDFS